jgi:hypothetical protein
MARRKKMEAGKGFTFNSRDDEHDFVIEWFNQQDNVTDSIRYLIEQDIAIFRGVRNLQEYIPSKRSLDRLMHQNQLAVYQTDSVPPGAIRQIEDILKSENGKWTPVEPVTSNVTEVEKAPPETKKLFEPQVREEEKTEAGKADEITIDDISGWE